MGASTPTRRLFLGAAGILLAMLLAWGPLLLERSRLDRWQLPDTPVSERNLGSSPVPPLTLGAAQEAELLRRAAGEPSLARNVGQDASTDEAPPGIEPHRALRTVAVSSFLFGLAQDQTLWLLEPLGLWRFRPGQDLLTAVPLPHRPGMTLVAMEADSSGVWVSSQGPDGRGGLFRVDKTSLKTLEAPTQARVVALAQTSMHMVGLTHPSGLLLLRTQADDRLDMQPLSLPPALQGLALKSLVALGDSLFLLTEAGAVWSVSPSAQPTGTPEARELLPPPPAGPGVMGMVAVSGADGSDPGLVLRSNTVGLLFWRPGGGSTRVGVASPGALPVRWGSLLVLDSEARYAQVAVAPGGKTPAGADPHPVQGRSPTVWGIHPDGLERYNGVLERRVRYAGEAELTGQSPVRAGQSSLFPDLADVRSLMADNTGLWILARDRLSRFDLLERSMRTRLLATGDPSAQSASSAEIEASLALIASRPPHERRAAYLTLLEKTHTRYDEVFLVGLNESDADTLEVVVEYFRTHHPREAIEPLLDVLLLLQADVVRRRHLVQVLASFGPPVIGPVATRMQEEIPQALESGAGDALEQILVTVVEQGGPELLNRFLATSSPEFLYRYGAADEEAGQPGGGGNPPQITSETFALLAERLRRAVDPLEIEGLLRITGRLVRTPSLPPEVAQVVPPLIARLEGPFRRYALYALALLPDETAVGACQRVYEQDPDLRFWALQALAGVASGEALQPVLLALNDPHAEIRLAAAALVGLEMIPEGAPALRRMLLEEEQGICIPCIESLMALRDPLAKPVLLARLASARREEQALILRALTGMGDPLLAQSVAGWLELEILGPVRAARLGLADGPALEVLRAGLALIALHAGAEAPGMIERLTAGSWPVESHRRLAALRARALVLNGLFLRLGLSGALEASFVSSGASKGEPGDPDELRDALFRLIPSAADTDTHRVLATLLGLPIPLYWQEEAARGLWLLKDRASLPMLTTALKHPRFVAGPFPAFRYPVRLLAARALERLGVRVVRRADRSIALR